MIPDTDATLDPPPATGDDRRQGGGAIATSTGDRSIPGDGIDEHDLAPGDQVGEYRVVGKIGQGGFGAVFAAEQPLIGKDVAIKVLSRQYSADPAMVSRFVAEARAVNQIRHESIIDIFSFGQLEDGRHYYVMEHLVGRPMDEYLEASGPLPVAEALPILREVAQALDAAHAKGIAHRDLKPENVFLVEGQGRVRPKLLDFGIAKLLSDDSGTTMHKTRTGAPIGTPSYMSPEQCRGRRVDHRTDIYSFGCMAYRVLTGQVPFDGEDYMEILVKQVGEDAPKPSTLVSSLSPAVDAAIAWMMAKSADDRPPSLRAAVDALEEAARDAATGSAMPTPAPAALAGSTAPTMLAPTEATGELPRQRGRIRWVAAAGIAGVLLAAAAYLATRGDDGSEAAARTEPPAPAEPSVAPQPAVAADAAATEPASAPPDAAPALVTVEVAGPPPGTEVYAPGGGLVGTAPGAIQLRRGDEPLVITFRADGFRPASAELTPDRDQALEVKLERKVRRKRVRPRRDRAGQSGRNRLEDPFSR